ncbi:MAG: hypothetical protein NTY12_03115 [Candidatus Falkowbacteria bacterium]|nr:hypothetical protein [Candidatus Falkowbacteria bacterium]
MKELRELPYNINPRFSLDLASKLTEKISEAFSSNQPFDIVVLSAMLEASTNQKIELVKKVFGINPYPIIPSLDKKFEASRYEFDVYVDGIYKHENTLGRYRSVYPELFSKSGESSAITDSIYSKKVDKLLPRKMYRVRLFKIITRYTNFYEIFHFLENQKSMIVGPQGLCQLYAMCKHKLPNDIHIAAPHVFDNSESSGVALLHTKINDKYLYLKDYANGAASAFKLKNFYVIACYQK